MINKCKFCNLNNKECKCIQQASDSQLKLPEYRLGMKYAVTLSKVIPQFEWKTAIQNALLLADGKDIKLFDPAGMPIDIPLVDDNWSGNDRYIRDFLASKKCTKLEYDRLIDLYFRIMLPESYRILESGLK